MEAALPIARFPALRGQRLTYLHLRKITDAHAGLHGWRLVLESDMLFFRRPTALLDWCDAPASPIHMQDVQDAYGYPVVRSAEPTADVGEIVAGVGTPGADEDGVGSI